MPQTFVKDPEGTLDYQIDWSDWLGDDTIVSSAWAVGPADDIVIDSDSHTVADATVWLSGGTVGITYRVTNTIVTAAGRTDERSIKVCVMQR